MTTEALARATIREALQTQIDGDPVVRLDSPPGAGKTRLVEQLGVLTLVELGERCAVATQTNSQAFDVVERVATRFPASEVWLFAKSSLRIPANLRALGNVRIARRQAEIPGDASIVVANAAKWSWVNAAIRPFDLLVVDEAFQLTDSGFHQIANIGERIVLVGDPGQIDPVVASKVERWRGNPAGPHLACPEALLARHPDIRRLRLPVSRRLPADTVEIIQPAFYPDLPFTALATPGERRLIPAVPGRGGLDRAIDRATDGASLVLAELDDKITGQSDDELAGTIAALVQRLLDRRTVIFDGRRRELTPADIGVVCSHVTQVNAVAERLGLLANAVLVDTANRFQGLERAVMIAWHPLAGRPDAKEFHLDAGRLCVMLSRHRVACFTVSRVGVEDRLLAAPLTGERVLGIEHDGGYEGWLAHVRVLASLRSAGSVVHV